jgi:hypothetical protein
MRLVIAILRPARATVIVVVRHHSIGCHGLGKMTMRNWQKHLTAMTGYATIHITKRWLQEKQLDAQKTDP